MTQYECYTGSFVVCANECDPLRRMKLGDILRRTQQIATDQCDALGLTAEVYARTHTAFLLAKTAVHCRRMPRERERVTLVTRPSAPQRAVYYRYTTLEVNGEVLAEVDSRWVLVDTQTRRILRRAPEAFPALFTAAPAAELDVAVHRVDVQPVSSECATFTRCDENRHMNNTVYADIVCDALPLEQAMAGEVERFSISYHNEAPLGTQLTLSRGTLRENAWYFVGHGQDKRFFEAELVLKL